MRFDDLVAFHQGAIADEAFPYIPPEDRERMQTGRCPEHMDSTPRIVPPSQAPPPWWRKEREGTDPEALRARVYARRSGTSDLLARHIRCSWEGCDERGIKRKAWASSTGMQVSPLCASHAEQARRQELEARASGGRVRRDDWSKVIPMTEWVELPPPDRVWSEDEWQVIRYGFKPRHMEEKWFWFVEGMVLFAHRSWTGLEGYRARFELDGDDYRIAELRAATGTGLAWLDEHVDRPQLGAQRFVELVDHELLRL